MNRLYRRLLGCIGLLSLLVILAVTGSGCRGEEENTELVGKWRYDAYTVYEFTDAKKGCICLDQSTHYDFTYRLQDQTLYIDFVPDYVTDCTYTYSKEDDQLTLIGGEGTSEPGKSYVLTLEK